MSSGGNQSGAAQNDVYERNPENDLLLGPEFEANVAIYSMLTLLQNDQHAIAVEYKTAPAKFDDVVLRVQNGDSYEYYFRQLKHRDSANKDLDACLITWNDLLTSKKGSKFGIPCYFEAQGTQSAWTSAGVKELGFVTNYNLIAKQNSATSASNLKDLANSLLHSNAKDKKYDITLGDLNIYFQEWNDSSKWRPPTINQKSYKFTEKAIDDIFSGAQTGYLADNKILDPSYKTFLGLLVFHVSMPHVEELKTINQQLLKLFFPFHKDSTSDKYGYVTENFAKLFADIIMRGYKSQAIWATVNRRCELFNQIAIAWKTAWENPIYNSLAAPFELLNYPREPPLLASILDEILLDVPSIAWSDNPMKIVNIYNAESNALAITLKVLKTIEYYASKKLKTQQVSPALQRRVTIMQVTSKKSADDIVEYLDKLDKEVSNFSDWTSTERFCCVIQIFPFHERTETVHLQIIKRLASFINIRKWIRFAIITQQPIMIDDEHGMDLEKIEVTPLSWGDLSIGYKKLLFENTLHLENGAETSLRALGFEQDEIGEWLHSRALSELIDHDKEKPLNLGLPRKDASLDTDYIEREIQLPLVKNNSKTQNKSLFTCNETAGAETSLRALGFEQDEIGERLHWLHSRLSELIDHDKEKPLNPQNKLLFTCNENDFYCDGSIHRDRSANQPIDEYQHLLSPVDSKRHTNVCLWMKAKEERSILDLKYFVVRSKNSDVTKHEQQLLEDKVNFGTGSTDNKLHVVVDYPGKGKSCLLTSLSNRFLDDWASANKPNGLLLRVNLREIRQWEECCGNGVEFLMSHSNIANRDVMIENTNLATAIVNRKLTSGPPSVFVFLDGYDEISDDQRRKTLDVLDDLKKKEGIKRIILTSRPEANLEGVLEQHFRQFSLHLKNFDRADQIRYLTKRWTAKVGNMGLGVESVEKIKQFAEALVDFSKKALKGEDEDENETFLSIPLQCWIFSECFYQQLTKYLMSGHQNVPQFDKESFEILRLYDQFFEAKIDVFLQEKANIPLNGGNEALSFLRNDVKELYLKSLVRLSILHLMEKTDEAECICRLNWENYRSETKTYCGEKTNASEFEKDIKRAIKLGVVQGCSGDDKTFSFTGTQDIKFLHRTFAEYFSARYLFQNFTQEKSELFEGAISRQELTDKSFEIIAGKMFVTPEFAGVRRFLDRMLANQVSPAGELCPFANEDRSNVLKKWPVIGHQRFNESLAKSIILTNALDVEGQSFRAQSKASEFSEENYQQLIKQAKKEKQLPIILREGCEDEPFITSILIHCIKEYASRPEISGEEREKLAYSVTLTLLRKVMNTKYREKMSGEINNRLAHWFDPTAGLPSTAKNVFTKWIFIFVNVLARVHEGSDDFKSDLIASICKALEYHKDNSDFDESIYAIVSSRLFAMKDENKTSYSCAFFRIREEYWFKKRENRPTDSLFEEIVVSLSTGIVSSPTLFQRSAYFLVRKLSQHTQHAVEYLRNLAAFLDSLKNAGNLRTKEGWLLSEVEKPLQVNSYSSTTNFVFENVVRPYAFIETIKFFMIKSKLPESRSVKLLKVSLKYIICIQSLLFRIIYLNSLLQAMLASGKSVSLRCLSTTMLWYFLVSDTILSYMSDTDDMRAQAVQNVFFTEIGQKSLTAYAHATCCCQCKDEYYREFGIHFPRNEKYSSDSIVGPFQSLFADKLKFLWNNGKSEREFIDFLIKGFELVTEYVPELGGRVRRQEQGAASSRPTCYTVEEAESRLRDIHLSKLPCLLFSDVVGEYIPQKLSPAGLNHLINKLKTLPLVSCERNCFRYDQLQYIPVTTNLKISILDGILQEDVTSPRLFKCKATADRIKAFQDKLQKSSTT